MQFKSSQRKASSPDGAPGGGAATQFPFPLSLYSLEAYLGISWHGTPRKTAGIILRQADSLSLLCTDKASLKA